VIVSCEACQSRYKLDDSKVSGKGAKITCPKCKHVFIVRAPEPAAEDATMAFPRPAPPAPPPAPARAVDTTVPLGEPEPTEVRASKGDVAAQAAMLDFRKVGVIAWKVKVKIGLIYDFSDIKTLRKYISEGRVTAADVISHDGKNWRQIGEIGDLDTFFIQTYTTLEASYTPPAAAAPKPTPPPADDMAAAAAAAAAAEEPEEKGPRFNDPFAGREKSARARPRPGQPAAVPAGRSPVVVGMAAAALLAIVGGWWFTRTPPPAPTPVTTAPTPPTPATPKPDAGKELRDKVHGDIDAQLRNRDVAPITTAPDDMELVPINRGATSPTAAGGPALTPVPPRTTATASTANDHLAVGNDAARSGDWQTAAIAYGKAAASAPNDAALHLKWGEALVKAGNAGAAVAPLTKAGNGRQARAWRLLGDMARQDGDTAGANGYYEKYLATNPPDAAAVKALMGAG
jgi:predicted Zn finger-like uncharacterized protein